MIYIKQEDDYIVTPARVMYQRDRSQSTSKMPNNGNNTKYSKKAILGIVGMLLFGTGTMISSKLMMDCSACPKYIASEYPDLEPWEHGKCPQYLKKKFEKPWYQTGVMFAAMSLCLVGHFGNHFYTKWKRNQLEQAHKRGEQLEFPLPQVVKHDWKAYLYIGVPAVFDMLATTLMTFGLEFINVSIMQMLRGAMVVFTTLFNICFLKRKVQKYQWTAVGLTVFALFLVGLSSVLGTSDDPEQQSWTMQLVGCLLVVASTAIQAIQVVLEDVLLNKVQAYPLQIVGMEGIWGFFVTGVICTPLIMFAIPGSDHGHQEDANDTIYMMADNPLIIAFSAVYFISILMLNWAGMVVTQETNSVVRSIFEAVRTCAIWITNLLIYYAFAPNTVFGEPWTPFSFLQLAGFVLLIFASQVYSAYVIFPMIFKYPEQDKATLREQQPLLGDDESDKKDDEI